MVNESLPEAVSGKLHLASPLRILKLKGTAEIGSKSARPQTFSKQRDMHGVNAFAPVGQTSFTLKKRFLRCDAVRSEATGGFIALVIMKHLFAIRSGAMTGGLSKLKRTCVCTPVSIASFLPPGLEIHALPPFRALRL